MPASPEIVQAVTQVLHEDGRPTYALLDAARDPGVLGFIAEFKPEHRSLYAGIDEELVEYGPFLVALDKDQLAALVARAWGESWGVFVKTRAGIESVRRHFRKFLMVELETGEEVYFRFYDPRVLRGFLPTCDGEQWQTFMEGIELIAMEADTPGSLLKFDARVYRSAASVLLNLSV